MRACWFLSIACSTVLAAAAIARDVLTLESQLVTQRPSIDADGIQFDLTNAFVTDLSPEGSRLFFTTHDGGRTWSNLTIRQGNRNLGQPEDLRVSYYHEGNGVVYYNGNSYCVEEGGAFRKSLIKSVMLRGQDGFRVESKVASPNKFCLFRTKNGGRSWFDTSCPYVPFAGLESFDLVATNLLIACVYAENSTDGSKHRLVKSFDSGRTWASVSNPEIDVGVWATHVFFLNETTGWISSDRDDGMFLTLNAGKIWREIAVPERVIRAIYFKDARHGRIIGGVYDNVYETTDAGQSWRKLAKAEIVSPSFVEYFALDSLARWNDFAVLRSILATQ